MPMQSDKAPKKKIALVYDAIFPYVKGGGEKRFHEIGKQLARNGHDVHLYGMKLWDGPTVITRDGMTLHGISKSRPLYTKSGRRTMLQPILFGFSCFKLLREDFDVIDCCGFPYFSLFVCRFVALVKGKRLFATWHEVWGKKYWHDYLGSLGAIGYFVERLAARMPHHIISVSTHTADALKEKLGVRQDVAIIENGIHVEEIARITPATAKSDVVYAGRLVDLKNIDVLMRAIAIVKKTQPKISCLIVGDGPERNRLEKLAKTLKLAKNVIFTGFLDHHDDVVAAMKSSKVFVLPSSREGFGMVVVEANAAGLPVVTVNETANAAQTLIGKTNGVVADLNPAALAAAIIHAQAHFSTSQCVASAKHYGWQQIVRKLEGVFA